jgi:hypothetical protein
VSLWGTYGPRPEPNHVLDALFGSMTAEADIDVACEVAQAWDLVSTVERIGEFSPECVEAAWLPDHPRDWSGPGSKAATASSTTMAQPSGFDLARCWSGIHPAVSRGLSVIVSMALPRRGGHSRSQRSQGECASRSSSGTTPTD